jgi:adenosylhomocysteine nucleosidase
MIINAGLKLWGMHKLKFPVLLSTIILLTLSAGCRIESQTGSPYLIIYAFDAEGQLLKEKMEVIKEQKVLGRLVYSGKLSGKDIVLAESGVGMTNAAMTTQKLIDMHNPEAVIFTGIAGAIDTSVHIGDIVICRSWITHDYVYHGADGPMPGGIRVYVPEIDSIQRKTGFDTDSALFAVADKLLSMEIQFTKIGDRTPEIYAGGVGVSGNAFIDNYEKRLWLSENFQALITDMESAALAQVCTANGVPFIVFRSASDLAGGSGSSSARDELDKFFGVAAENSSTLVMEFLKAL